MSNLRIIKYPGAKGVLVPEIKRVFLRSGKLRFVDALGGSGAVSLNLDAGETVYNDLNQDLVNIFNVIKWNPDAIESALSVLASFLKNGHVKNPGKGTARDPVKLIRSRMPPMTREEEMAIRAIYGFSATFGGMGSTYATEAEKSVGRYIEKTLKDFPKISKRVFTWEIKNLDFRALVEKYNTEESFFYFDPPYPGKTWYNQNFSHQDFKDLRGLFPSIKGNYLMNLEADDKHLLEMFGKPTFVKSYRNANGKFQALERPLRVKAFYTNVQYPGTST